MKRHIYFYCNGLVCDLYDSCFEEVNDSNVYAFTVFAFMAWKDQNNTCDLPQMNERFTSVVFIQMMLIATSQSLSCQTSHWSPSVRSEAWMPEYTSYCVHHWSQVKSIVWSSSRIRWIASLSDSNSVSTWVEIWKWEQYGVFFWNRKRCASPGLMEGALGLAYCVIEEVNEICLLWLNVSYLACVIILKVLWQPSLHQICKTLKKSWAHD